MIIKTHDIDTPKGRRDLQKAILEQTLNGLCATLGPGFTAHEASDENRIRGSWRAINIAIERLDRLDDGVKEIAKDIISTGARHFMRMDGDVTNLTTQGEKGGICMRVCIAQIYGKLPTVSYRLDIDWICWR